MPGFSFKPDMILNTKCVAGIDPCPWIAFKKPLRPPKKVPSFLWRNGLQCCEGVSGLELSLSQACPYARQDLSSWNQVPEQNFWYGELCRPSLRQVPKNWSRKMLTSELVTSISVALGQWLKFASCWIKMFWWYGAKWRLVKYDSWWQATVTNIEMLTLPYLNALLTPLVPKLKSSPVLGDVSEWSWANL